MTQNSTGTPGTAPKIRRSSFKCPLCGHPKSRVVKVWEVLEDQTRYKKMRIRICYHCSKHFATGEFVEPEKRKISADS